MRWNIKNDTIPTKEQILDVLLKNRGIEKGFLKNYSADDLIDPFEIYDMQKCVDRIRKAIDNGEKIFIHGDFDVDGTAATATLWSYLYYYHKAKVLPYIPHRVDEGYGMSKKTIDNILEEGGNLIITVDCGVKDIELTEYIKSKGADVIISDHHEFVHDDDGNPILADTIVIHGMHPKAQNKNIICGGVTAWKIACALEKSFTGEAYTERTLAFLDLAAITTLTDIMPLKDENRVIVSLGLNMIRNRQNKLRSGVEELIKVSQFDRENINTYHIGFMLGPRLNAPGRVENSAMDSLRLLCTSNQAKAKELAQKLDELNKKRQFMTEKYMDEARVQIEHNNDGTSKNKVIFAWGTDWPEGIVGLVAGKIAEKYYRPTFIMSYNTHEDKVTGSARSIKNFHLVKALDECKEHLTRYGGHYMAAGYSTTKDNIEKFKKAIQEVGEKILKPEDIIPELNVDCVLSDDFIDINLVNEIENLSPFGYGNTTPIFAYKNAILTNIRNMGQMGQHAKYTWKVGNNLVDGVIFNTPDHLKNLQLNLEYDIAFNLDINEWNNKKSVQLSMKDVRSAGV